MPSTKIRGNTQIMDYTVDVGRLEQDFLGGTDWDITNGNQDALITGLKLTPVNDADAASKYYVDSVAAGLDWKDSAQFTTLTDISAVYTSTGGTGGSGAFTGVDLTSTGIFDLGGHSVSVNDRVLIRNQTDEKQNGIYIVTSTGASGGLERASDHDGQPGSEVSAGNAIFVESGSTYAQTGWVLQGDGTLTLNTDNLSWTQFSGSGTYTAGNGLDLTGTTFSVNVDNSTIEISADTLRVKADGINDTHIDWGTGANQVSAADMPVDASGFSGELSVSDTDVQTALSTLDAHDHDDQYSALGHNHSGTYAENAFTTIATDAGTNPVADSTTDTLTLQSSSGVIVVTGNSTSDSVDFDIAVDGINDTHIDWGSGANQVNATDVPIDSGGTWGGSATNVQDALEELEGAQAKFVTIDTEFGTDPVADTTSDTLVLRSSTGAITITGSSALDRVDFDIAVDGVKDTHIDWGTSTGQVSAVDMPIADAGTLFVTDNVEAALQEVMTDVNAIEDNGITGGNGISTSGTIGADNLTVTADVDGTSIINTGGGGAQLAVATDGINDTHIDWGSGANQVDAEDMPLSSTGTYAGTAVNVQDALEELESSISGHFAFGTISVPTGTNAVADATSDTLTLATGGPITITGSDPDTITFDIGADSINDTHIDWGTGAGQVNADDVPIIDAGAYFTSTGVEGALQEIAAILPGMGITKVIGEAPTVTHSSPNISLANTPIASSLIVYLNGLRMKYTDDYTLSGSTVTFTFNLLQTPGQSDVVIVDYEY